MSDRRTFLRRSGNVALLSVLAAGCRSPISRAIAGPPTLSQWYHDYGQAAAERAARRYARSFGKATVTVRWIAGDYPATLAAGLLGTDPPDVFDDQLSDDLVKSGQVVALDDVLGTARDDFFPADLSTNTVGGRLYGIPMVQDVQLLYYRRSLLDKAGVAPPATVDGLLTAAGALTTAKVKGLFVGNDGGVGALGGPALCSAGLSYVTPDRRVGFDSPRAAAALTRLRDLYAGRSLLLGAARDWPDPAPFIEGRTAMQWTGSWAMPAIVKALGDDVGVAAYPALDPQGTPAVPITSYAAMVDARSTDVDAAKAFVKWLWVDQTAYQEDFALNYGFHLPPRKSIAAKAMSLQGRLPAAAVRLSQQYAVPAAPPYWTPKMSAAYTAALANIIRRGAKPGPELGRVAATVRGELRRLSG